MAIASKVLFFHVDDSDLCAVLSYECATSGNLELYGARVGDAEDIAAAAWRCVVDGGLPTLPQSWLVSLDTEMTMAPAGRATVILPATEAVLSVGEHTIHIFPSKVDTKAIVEPISGAWVGQMVPNSSQWRAVSAVMANMEATGRVPLADGLRTALSAHHVSETAMAASVMAAPVVDPLPPPPPSIVPDNVIGFYGASGPYGFLSNFYKVPYLVRTTTYDYGEVHFQSTKAMRFGYVTEANAIRAAYSPSEAKKLGRPPYLNLSLAERADWDAQSYDVMKEVLRAKFRLPHMRGALLATAPAILEEQAVDRIWGTGVRNGRGNGQNLLGRALMEVRAELA